MDHVSPMPAVALVAEDEALVRLVAADMLEEAGFNVVEVGDAQAALAHLIKHPEVTLLFTDIDMPGPMDGIDLSHEVARRWPHITVLICSGRVQPSVEALPDRAHFISKPYSHTLVQQILVERGLP